MPFPDSLKHNNGSMSELEDLIKDRIKAKGPMTFESFMAMALYHPGLGYYASPGTEIGRAGDFYTSPHLHPIFGAMLGRQAEEMWEVMGKPSEFTIVEAGGGRGWLARDLLDHLRGRDICDSLSYVMVELNPEMKERQATLLKDHAATVEWADALETIKPITGLILTNELFDAMPVHLIEQTDGGLMEIYVSLDGDTLVESPGAPSSPSIEAHLKEFGISLPARYRTEVNLRMKEWLEAAASVLENGFLLTIDYGYPARELYMEERDRGTLLCYHRHEVNENPLINIGEQDITAHINFSAMKRWGDELGLKSLGFTRQGPYLVSLGIDEMLEELLTSSPDYQSEINKVKGLIMPGAMGDTHKVLVQYKGNIAPEKISLRGFKMRNEAGSL